MWGIKRSSSFLFMEYNENPGLEGENTLQKVQVQN